MYVGTLLIVAGNSISMNVFPPRQPSGVWVKATLLLTVQHNTVYHTHNTLPLASLQ